VFVACMFATLTSQKKEKHESREARKAYVLLFSFINIKYFHKAECFLITNSCSVMNLLTFYGTQRIITVFTGD
jgi:hypothetical protein